MTKTRWFILALFIVAFVAGGAVSWTIRPPGPKPMPRGGSFLIRELNLTAQQQQEMRKIWSNLGREGWHQDAERRKAIQRQRDEAIRDLVPADKKKELDQILENHQRLMSDLGEQRRRNYESAVEKTKAILTPAQLAQYEQILSRRPPGSPPGSPPGNPGPGSPPGPGGPMNPPENPRPTIKP